MTGQHDEQDPDRSPTADPGAPRDEPDRVVHPDAEDASPDRPPSDAELIASVRTGAIQDYGQLFERHVTAARGLARALSRSATEADDLVSEAFAKVLDVLRAGGGPDAAFRPYLLTALRHTAYDKTRRDKPLRLADDVAAVSGVEQATSVPFHDPAVATLERFLVAKAFAGLPERWRAVLWQTEIEGQSPAEVAPLLGMTGNGVSALAHRAREGLKKAYLQAHLEHHPPGRCRAIATRLGAWTRHGLNRRESAQVEAHLDGCPECRSLAAELADVNGALRAVVAPLVLGAGVGGYLAGTAGTTQAGPATASTAHWVVAGAATAAVVTALVWGLGAGPGPVTPTRPASAAEPTTTASTAIPSPTAESAGVTITGTTPATTTAPTTGAEPAPVSTGTTATTTGAPTASELLATAPAGVALSTGGPPTDLPITVRNTGATPVPAPALTLGLPEGVQVVGPGGNLRHGPVVGLDGARAGRVGCPAGRGAVTCAADRELAGGESVVFVFRLLAGPKSASGSITGTADAGRASTPIVIPVEIRPGK
ncbi:sigma-70 family RNA polymerase sigma factor [Actinosynnema sp. NPDC023587]|uniref:sigma-70 family RNA polymerase sigma factor n=1 Tax=Actinosynnema sp. NPDC023587 TaxID=3154695 RepID=UPI00340FFE7D